MSGGLPATALIPAPRKELAWLYPSFPLLPPGSDHVRYVSTFPATHNSNQEIHDSCMYVYVCVCVCGILFQRKVWNHQIRNSVSYPVSYLVSIPGFEPGVIPGFIPTPRICWFHTLFHAWRTCNSTTSFTRWGRREDSARFRAPARSEGVPSRRGAKARSRAAKGLLVMNARIALPLEAVD